MKILLALVLVIFISCETNRFDSDKRQIVAKDAIRRKIQENRSSFTVTGFKEDTLFNYSDTLIQKPIQYTLFFKHKNSSGEVIQQTGVAIFTSKGNSLLSAQILDQQP